MIDRTLSDHLLTALRRAEEAGDLAAPVPAEVTVGPPADAQFGDFTSNVALGMAKAQRRAPRQVAEAILRHLDAPGFVASAEIAGPGHLNFVLEPRVWHDWLLEILALDDDAPLLEVPAGARERILVEYVSANPTGPLHIGHGRGAALGDSLTRVMRAAGYDVTREFYINDAGNQIRTLGESVYGRMRELRGETVAFGEDYYMGEYIREIAEDLLGKRPELLDMDREKAVTACTAHAATMLLEEQKRDLRDFRVAFDLWSSERALIASGAIEATLDDLKARGHSYEEDGALWFLASAFGDEKDRVLVKSDGARTYFANDMAFHRDKLRRGFTRLINIWGADHHGYVPRVRASLEALGYDPQALEVLILQLVHLKRGGESVSMGKRAGKFVTVRELIDEVGVDAARFFFLTRRADASLDFDLELAKKHSLENPVYHVQYVHARIQSIFRRLTEEDGWKSMFRREEFGEAPRYRIGMGDEAREVRVNPGALAALTLPEELALIRKTHEFFRVVEGAAAAREPHRLTSFLVDLASAYHSYYTMGNRDRDLRVLSEDAERSEARVVLSAAVQFVVRRGLGLLGVNAPERM